MSATTTSEAFAFLKGGGELGHLTRTYPWAQTPLGPPGSWPLSLRITLGFLLHSAFPMFLFWGNDLTCFYNDAYRPSLGTNGKHPALGQPARAVWPEIWDFIGPLIGQVMATGEPVWYEDQLVPIFRNGQLEDVYWTFSYSPAYGDEGQIAGVLVTCTETTQKVLSVSQLRHSEESLTHFKYMVENATDPFILMREDGTFAYLNQLALDRWGYTTDEARHLRVADVDPIYAGTAFTDLFAGAQVGKLPPFDTLHRKKDGTTYPVEINMGGLLLDGKPHLFAVARDITDRKKAEVALRASEQRFQAAIAAVQGILWTNNASGEMEGAQPGWASLTGQRYDEYQGYGWATAVHPDDAQPTIAAWELAVARRGTFIFEHRVRVAAGHWELFSCRAIPLLNADGSIREWVGVHTNITRQREAEVALRESEARFRNLILQAPVAIALFRGPQFVIELANERVLEYWGRSMEQVSGLPLFEALPEASGQGFEELLTSVLTTGTPVIAKELPVDLMRGGVLEKTYIDFVYEPYYEAGQAAGVMVVANEITEQVLARQKIEEAEANLRGAIEMAELGTWQIDLTKGVLDYSARLRGWFGIGPDERITPERAYQSVSAADRPRVEVAISRAIAADSDGFYDIEYAVDPAEAGRERVLHIQGRTFFTEKGQPYKLSGTARDITEQRRVQQELERKVAERTQQLEASVRDLERSNQNLQQFAYVASHDLQEPLRKIQSFGSILVQQYAKQLGEGTDLLERMQTSASRMSILIQDLLSFSRISTKQEATATVSLTKVVNNVLLDLELRIQETRAAIEVAPLPNVLGDASQLGQLFQNLLTNALKFTQTSINPQISVSSQLVEAADLPPTVRPTRPARAYHRIDVADNGIGFDEKYLDRIFQVFQRLHGRNQYPGTGVGLAICEKVAANHGGGITATGHPGKGATFSVFLPA